MRRGDLVAGPSTTRRAVLIWMGSVACAGPLSMLGRGAEPVSASQCLPDALQLLATHDTCRQARRQVRAEPCPRPALQAALARLRDAADTAAVDQYERQVRQDVVSGRVATVGGWVVAETELALLSLVERE